MCFKHHNKVCFLKLKIQLWGIYLEQVILITSTINVIWKQTKNTTFGIKETPECESMAWTIVRGWWGAGRATPKWHLAYWAFEAEGI